MQNRHILIVEDNPEFLKTVTRTLQTANYQTSGAANGVEALEVLKAESINLVLADVRMPFMDGIELLKTIKRKYNIPVLMMTGFQDIIQVTDAYKWGADDFFSKPFTSEELLTSIKKNL